MPSFLSHLIRNLLVRLEGTDYKERFLRLSEEQSLSDLIGSNGKFKAARGGWYDCEVTGVIVRKSKRDALVINYTTRDGYSIEGAHIPRDAFHPSPLDS